MNIFKRKLDLQIKQLAEKYKELECKYNELKNAQYAQYYSDDYFIKVIMYKNGNPVYYPYGNGKPVFICRSIPKRTEFGLITTLNISDTVIDCNDTFYTLECEIFDKHGNVLFKTGHSDIFVVYKNKFSGLDKNDNFKVALIDGNKLEFLIEYSDIDKYIMKNY